MAPLSDNIPRKRHLYDTAEKHDDDDDDALLSQVGARKRVRFAMQWSGSTDAAVPPLGDVAKEVHESTVLFDDLDKESLWWSKEERTEIADFTRKLARGFKRQYADRVSHYLRVFEECSKAPSHSSSDFLETVTLGVPSEVRGLECGFVPSIKAYRKQHAQEVLDTQSQLRKGRLSEVVCRRVLSARATRSSRPSRVMARLMGEADAIP